MAAPAPSPPASNTCQPSCSPTGAVLSHSHWTDIKFASEASSVGAARCCRLGIYGGNRACSCSAGRPEAAFPRHQRCDRGIEISERGAARHHLCRRPGAAAADTSRALPTAAACAAALQTWTLAPLWIAARSCQWCSFCGIMWPPTSRWCSQVRKRGTEGRGAVARIALRL